MKVSEFIQTQLTEQQQAQFWANFRRLHGRDRGFEAQVKDTEVAPKNAAAYLIAAISPISQTPEGGEYWRGLLLKD